MKYISLIILLLLIFNVYSSNGKQSEHNDKKDKSLIIEWKKNELHKNVKCKTFSIYEDDVLIKSKVPISNAEILIENFTNSQSVITLKCDEDSKQKRDLVIKLKLDIDSLVESDDEEYSIISALGASDKLSELEEENISEEENNDESNSLDETNNSNSASNSNTNNDDDNNDNSNNNNNNNNNNNQRNDDKSDDIEKNDNNNNNDNKQNVNKDNTSNVNSNKEEKPSNNNSNNQNDANGNDAINDQNRGTDDKNKNNGNNNDNNNSNKNNNKNKGDNDDKKSNSKNHNDKVDNNEDNKKPSKEIKDDDMGINKFQLSTGLSLSLLLTCGMFLSVLKFKKMSDLQLEVNAQELAQDSLYIPSPRITKQSSLSSIDIGSLSALNEDSMRSSFYSYIV